VYCATTNVYDIVADQGATLLRSIALKSSAKVPVPLINYTARMQVRTAVSAATTVLTLTTSNGGVQINSAAGTLLIMATPTQTSGLTAGKYVYDLELEETATGIVTRILQGVFTVREEITR
jgi:hypothetical protein